MKSENTIKPKTSLEFILNSHSHIIENKSIHPAFKVTDNIYTTEKSSFFEKLNFSDKLSNAPSKPKPASITPLPNRYYKESKPVKNTKEDIFINPSAMYLSKKPIAFNKLAREAQKKKNLSFALPKQPTSHKKTKSFESNYNPVKLPKM